MGVGVEVRVCVGVFVQNVALATSATFDFSELNEKVLKIMKEIRSKGDKALIHYAHQFDGVD